MRRGGAAGGNGLPNSAAAPQPPRTGTFHSELKQRGITFHPFPPHETLGPAPSGGNRQSLQSHHALFIGQLTYDCTLEMLHWVLGILTKGTLLPIHVHRRGLGCAMAYFPTFEESERMRSLNGWALFDYTGVWVAENQDQAHIIQEYLQDIKSVVKFAHLPADAIVIRP